MKLIRGIITAVLVASMIICTGCAGADKKNDGTLDIVCTIFPQYDIARSIAGDFPNVNVKMLLGAGQESHDYDPSSKDIASVHDCDVFIYVGGESDLWVEDMLQSVDTNEKSVISLMNVVKPLKEEIVEGMETETEEHAHEHGAIDHVEYDEHVWTSPKNAVLIADAVLDAMCERMPSGAETFKKNHGALKDGLLQIDCEFTALVKSVESPVVIVADRFPLLYFCREYGIKYFAAFSGCAASTEPSSKTVQFLIEKINEENIPAVFRMDMSAGNVADTVSESTGAKVLTFYSCHTVSTDDFENGVTYTDLMKRNLSSLKEAFGK